MSRWDSRHYGNPAKRIPDRVTCNWYLWVVSDTKDTKTIIAWEHVYSTVYSRFLRLGDVVVSAGEAGGGNYIPPKGTRGVLMKILWPFEQGNTDYIFGVVFENWGLVNVKASHLVRQKYQQIKIGQPKWS